MPLTDAARKRRDAIHRHNGFLGSARWIISATDSIARSATATTQAQATAREINRLALRLATELRDRRD